MKYQRLPLLRYIIQAILCACMWLLPLQPFAFAQSSPPPPVNHPINETEVETFIDQFFGHYIGDQIPGLAFSLVKDGEILFSKGYGYSNLAESIPVDPDETIFRVGSVSKLFATTAALQLVQQGRLSVDDLVETYLGDLPIENDRYEPLKIRHLLTHTDGFDVAWSVNAATRCQKTLPPLEQFLRENLPPRVLPPGEMFMYGDAGMSVAGLLVERLSGLPFATYAEQNLLHPLAMNHSSFQQPLPPELREKLAMGYRYKPRSQEFVPAPFLCNKSTPTIGLSASANDMAHFMIAQLEGGTFDNTSILSDEWIKEMQRSQFSTFPTLPRAEGTTYGFFERFQNGYRAIEHGGSMYGFINQVFLMPEQHVGWFMAYNTNNLEDNIREELISEFLNYFYPGEEEVADTSEPLVSDAFQDQAQVLNGYYRFIRYPRHSIVKLGSTLLGWQPEYRIQSHENGTISVFPKNTIWVEVEPLSFQYPDSNSYFRFMQDDQGHIVAVTLSGFVSWIYGKVGWYETRIAQIIFLSLWISSIVAIAGIWFFQRIRKKQETKLLPSKLVRLTHQLMMVVSFLNLVFVAGFLGAFASIHYWEFFIHIPWGVVLLLYVPSLTSGLSVLLLCLGILTWQDATWNLWGRVQYSIFAIASGLFVLSMLDWNVLQFQLY